MRNEKSFFTRPFYYKGNSLASIGAMGYYFGNAVHMEEALEKMPADRLVMGNVDPAGKRYDRIYPEGDAGSDGTIRRHQGRGLLTPTSYYEAKDK